MLYVPSLAVTAQVRPAEMKVLPASIWSCFVFELLGSHNLNGRVACQSIVKVVDVARFQLLVMDTVIRAAFKCTNHGDHDSEDEYDQVMVDCSEKLTYGMLAYFR